MAGALNPYEATHAVLGQMDRASYTQRYKTLADLVERQYGAHLWNPEVGAWAAAEFNGVNRPRPHTCEQNYAIWRGLGDPLRNYMAMRFIRENYHRSDLLSGSTFEFINDWWPIIWSHQYPASGDTCASFHSACVTGQTDEFWPAFKSVYETAYINNGAMWHSTGSRSMEMEPLFLAAVVDGLFGVQPWLGDNRLVLRPSLPWAGTTPSLITPMSGINCTEAKRAFPCTSRPRSLARYGLNSRCAEPCRQPASTANRWPASWNRP
jgi:hypothetical protein